MKISIDFEVDEDQVASFYDEINNLQFGKFIEPVLKDVTIHKLVSIVGAGNNPKIKILSKWIHPAHGTLVVSNFEKDIFATIIDAEYDDYDKNCINFVIEGSTVEEHDLICQLTEDGYFGEGDVFTVGIYPYIDFDVEDRNKHFPYDFEIISL